MTYSPTELLRLIAAYLIVPTPYADLPPNGSDRLIARLLIEHGYLFVSPTGLLTLVPPRQPKALPEPVTGGVP